LINTTAIFCGSLAAPAFAEIVGWIGYSWSWIALMIVSLMTAPIIYLTAEPHGSGHQKETVDGQPEVVP
jgi:hypothetical protein